MRYIIMADGKGTRWNNYGDLPKHLLSIGGETILERTVRLLKQEDPSAEIIITSHDPRYEVPGATRYEPKDNILEIDRFTRELIEDQVCFLYGDTYYTAETLRRIAAAQADPLLFFGNSRSIVAVKVGDGSVFLHHFLRVRDLFVRKEIDKAIGWQVYLSFIGAPLDVKQVGHSFILVDDTTMDFNTPQDYLEKFQPQDAASGPADAPLPGRLARYLQKTLLRIRALPMTARGFTPSQAIRWIRTIREDLFSGNGISLLDKRTYHRMGFLSSTGRRFGVTRENHRRFISMKDYMYLFPINQKYSKWIYDKLTSYYILKPFHRYFPVHLYHLYLRDGEPRVIPLAAASARTYDALLAHLRASGPVHCVQTNRNNQQVLYYEQGAFYLDGTPCSENRLRAALFQPGKHFILREIPAYHPEFLHPQTQKPYCVRLIVTNEAGDNPEVSDAYIVLQEKQELSGARELAEITEDGSAKETGDADSLDIVRFCSNINVSEGTFRGCIGIVDNEYKEYDGLPGSNQTFAGRIPGWEEICEMVSRLCRFIPQAEFFGIDIHLTGDGFCIHRLLNQPPYPVLRPFTDTLTKYLQEKVAQKQAAYRSPRVRLARGAKKIKLRVRSRFARIVYPKGLIPYLSVTWIRDVLLDLFTNRDCGLAKKIWAYRHGYLSYRIDQYGIRPDNLKDHISDFEYKWLRHINCSYRSWMEDKITVKYIASEHKECFPAYYYYTTTKDGANKIIPMMDCPDGYGSSHEEIFRLLASVGTLALKPVEGSHGQGFYKLSGQDGAYWLNGEPASRAQVLAILQNPANQYLITEYISMHPQFREIYDGAVNTIRMVVFKKDGIHPVLGNAYMRFGSKKTGAVDNMGAGGMFARIDIDSGRYYDAKVIEHNAILPCPRHPDTGVLIDGFIPHWEKVKALVLQVAEAIPELEYFGFDLAVTENGIKFPEINRFPDYPKIETLSPATMDYLLYKLQAKKKQYGYDKKRPFRLINLPDRSKYKNKKTGV